MRRHTPALGFHLGVKIDQIDGGDIARTIYEKESYQAASVRDRALLTLAGGVTEDLIFGQRSPGCCKEDAAHLEDLLVELAPVAADRGRVHAELETKTRDGSPVCA